MDGDWTLTKTKLLQLATYRGGSLIIFQDENRSGVKGSAEKNSEEKEFAVKRIQKRIQRKRDPEKSDPE